MLVVKLGGGEGLNVPRACADLARVAAGRQLVIIHGVSAAMNQLCTELNVPVTMLTSPGGHSSRYTDARTRDIFVQAAAQVNQQIVELMQAQGIRAQGFVDADQVLIQGERKQALRAVIDGRVRMIRDDYSGSISGVNATTLQEVLAQGIVPVLPPLAISPDGLLNIDGDRASAAVAAALQAEELIILSNVRGLFSNFPDETSFVNEVSYQNIDHALDWAQGRMKRKVLGAQEAISQGVSRVIIADGRVTDPVSQALAGTGTTFR